MKFADNVMKNIIRFDDYLLKKKMDFLAKHSKYPENFRSEQEAETSDKLSEVIGH